MVSLSFSANEHDCLMSNLRLHMRVFLLKPDCVQVTTIFKLRKRRYDIRCIPQSRASQCTYSDAYIISDIRYPRIMLRAFSDPELYCKRVKSQTIRVRQTATDASLGLTKRDVYAPKSYSVQRIQASLGLLIHAIKNFSICKLFICSISVIFRHPHRHKKIPRYQHLNLNGQICY